MSSPGPGRPGAGGRQRAAPAAGSQDRAPSGGRVALRLACVNLLHGVDAATGAVDTAGAAAAVARLGADVVALQELDRGQPRSHGVDQVAAVADAVGGHARFGAALRGDPDTAWEPAASPQQRPGGRRQASSGAGGPAYGVGLVSRWPILGAATVPLPGGGPGTRARPATPARPGYDREPRVALRVVLDVAGRRVAVTTTHLSYLPWRGVRQLRTAVATAAAGLARSGGPAAVLAGDFNLPAAVVRASARGWRHAGGAPTHPAWRPRAQPDQVLVAGRVVVAGVAAGPRLTSDHLPLVVDLDLD